MLAETQRALADFLLHGDTGVVGALRADLPPRRLSVYRNAVLGSLAEVLAQAYPSVHRVLGDGFDALGRRYAAEAPPCQPMLWSYGAGFADWLEGTAPAGTPLWLADLARLDRAMHQALFAADADPLDPMHLASVPPKRAGAVRLMPHPSVRLVRSRWAVHALWKNPAASPHGAEAVLVGRPEAEVLCARLDAADGAAAAALLAGVTLETATDLGGDLQGLLGLLLHNRLVVGFALDADRSEGGDDR